MAPPIGYVFGYGALAAGLRRRDASRSGDGRYGHLCGARRAWSAAMDNAAVLNDAAHYVDPQTGQRPAIHVVALNLEDDDGVLNGIALPVDAVEIAACDRRELHYERVEVTERFSPTLGQPVWAYVANAQARKDLDDGRRRGAFISRRYWLSVQESFRRLGATAWREFSASTDRPAFALRDLEHTVNDGPTGLASAMSPSDPSDAAPSRTRDA